MTSVVDQLVNGAGTFVGHNGLWWAPILGVDFGGNVTVSEANVVADFAGRRPGSWPSPRPSTIAAGSGT